jgi:hypothetical protein|tara:strand:- start:237 stop:443 length:207 start_codon:yes stop_codon:yes gene_type:complete
VRIVTYSVTKAWSDEEFKAKLMADPKSVLKENGVDAAEALEVGIDENFKLLFSGRIIDNEKERRIEQG